MIPTRRWAALAALAVAGALAGCGLGGTPTPKPDCPSSAPAADAAAAILADAQRAVVITNKGTFTIGLEAETAPIAVANFVSLARCGFYDGITFHRVMPGFVAQAGDPQTRDNHDDFAGLGSGSPGYRFEVEFPADGTTYQQYMVAMANAIEWDRETFEISGPTDSNGSQFFVMLDDAPGLPPYYSVMGRVTDGSEVVDGIGGVPTNGPRGLPLDPVVIETIRIEGPAEESPA